MSEDRKGWKLLQRKVHFDSNHDKKNVAYNGFIVYTETNWQVNCGYSIAATNLLTAEGIEFLTVDVTTDQTLRTKVIQHSKHRHFPQIYVGRRYIGGFHELSSIKSAGFLHALHDVDLDTSALMNLNKTDIEQALTRKNIPQYATEALRFYLRLFEEVPEVSSIPFDVFCYAYLKKENLETDKASKKPGRLANFVRNYVEMEEKYYD